MTPTQRENLLVLAAHLEKVPEESFYWDSWVCFGPEAEDAQRLQMAELINLQGAWQFPCGTRGCVLGHACTMPHFQQQGLRLGTDLTPELEGLDWQNPVRVVRQLFGDTAGPLFFPDGSEPGNSARFVAAMIREYVRIRDTYGPTP